ncbi:MAG: cytochrome C family protein [Parcubacteria group bacterium Gr01-1014_46]|nr:MAG: cytochrome C family protein [Parcubacteria group bacterium Gr01-1014_46]
MINKKLFVILLVGISVFSVFSHMKASTNSNTSNFGKISCNGCGSGGNIRSNQVNNPSNFQAWSAQIDAFVKGYGSAGPSGGKYGIDMCLNSSGVMWDGSCWNAIDSNGAGNIGSASGNISVQRDIGGTSNNFTYAVASFYVNDAEITPSMTVYGRQVSIEALSTTNSTVAIGQDFDITWDVRDTNSQTVLSWSGQVSCDLGGSPQYVAENGFSAGTTCTATGSGTADFTITASGYSGTGNITISRNISVSINPSYAALDFIVKNQNGTNISGATVNIDQNFGNGTTRTTDSNGFANFGVNKNVTVGWGVTASNCTAVGGSQAVGNSNVTVNVTMNCTAGGGGGGPPTPPQPAVGNIEVANCSVISGVAADPDDLNASVIVALFTDRNAYATPPGNYIPPYITANTLVTRTSPPWPYVINNKPYGFSFTVPDSLKDGITHPIYIHAVDLNGTGPNNAIAGSGTITINCLPNAVPTLDTPTAVSITSTSAILGATLRTSGYPSSIWARGTCWGVSPSLMPNCSVEGGTALGAYSHSRAGMPANTTIYYHGYATNPFGTGYSSIGTFQTLPSAVATLSASTPVYPGGSITVNFAGVSAPQERDWIGMYLKPKTMSNFDDWKYDYDCTKIPQPAPPPLNAKSSGTCTFIASSTPGTYNFRLWQQDEDDVQYAVSNDVDVLPTPITGQCGSANNKFYVSTQTSYGSDTQCLTGTSNNTAFPSAGGTVPWTCVGSNGGGDSPQCTASRAYAPNGTLTVTSATTVGPGASVDLDFNNINTPPSPTPQDWIGLYLKSAVFPSPEIDYIYTSSCSRPADTGITRSSGTCTNVFSMPSTPGVYHFRLYSEDLYNVLQATSNDVTVVPAPTLTFLANPASIASGGSSSLEWTVSDATSCTASGDWSGSKSATNGFHSQSTGALVSNKTYNLSCTGLGGTTSTSASVTVTGGTHTVTVRANPGPGGSVRSSEAPTPIIDTKDPTKCPSIPCIKDYSIGSSVVLRAIPASSYWKFDSWSGCDSFSGSTCNLNIDSSKIVDAVFKPRIFIYKEF